MNQAKQIVESLSRLKEIITRLASVKGDLPGHPFRGNQWDGGQGVGEQSKYIVGEKDTVVSAIFKRGQEDAFIGSLTANESKALFEYKGEDPYAPGAAIALNGMLREGMALSREQQAALKEIDSAFRKAPRLKEDTILYRGTSTLMVERGGFIPSKGFMSTSVKREQAEGFSGITGEESYMYEIKVPKNFVAMPTSHFHATSSIAEEAEVLLPRNVLLKAVGRQGNTISLEVVGGEAWMRKR